MSNCKFANLSPFFEVLALRGKKVLSQTVEHVSCSKRQSVWSLNLNSPGSLPFWIDPSHSDDPQWASKQTCTRAAHWLFVTWTQQSLIYFHWDCVYPAIYCPEWLLWRRSIEFWPMIQMTSKLGQLASKRLKFTDSVNSVKFHNSIYRCR